VLKKKKKKKNYSRILILLKMYILFGPHIIFVIRNSNSFIFYDFIQSVKQPDVYFFKKFLAEKEKINL
jgi:hypothetical protein